VPFRGFCILLIAAAVVAAVPARAGAGAERPVRAKPRPAGTTAQLPRRCPNADTPAVSASTPAMRAAVLCLINKQRASRGLPTLHESRLLDLSAQTWTDTMVLTGIFSHGVNFAARITAAGFIWSAAGENIATGYPTPRAVVNAWMASKDHCENILDPLYLDVGTGVSRHPVGKWASGPSTWTQDFALPLHAGAPSNNNGPANGCPYK
jgi:uncharacterized protein YkwD